MATQPLQFAPGSRFAYSNFGMLMLGRIVAKVSGRPYEEAVRGLVLERMGIQRMRLGGSLPSQRALGEVDYYADTVLPALYPGVGDEVPGPDGGYYFEVIEGAGAWIASPVDLVRFADGVDGRRGTALLQRDLLSAIAARPAYGSEESHYGLGWVIDRSLGVVTWLHDGGLDGTRALLLRSEAAGGVSVAMVFNATPGSEEALGDLLDRVVLTVLSVRQWPAGDTYEEYLPERAPRISGVVNAASWYDAIAAGGLVTIDGMNLGGDGEVQVLFDGVPAPLLYVGRNQINARVPAVLRGGRTVRVEVVRAGLRAAKTVALAGSAPGLFTASGNGRGLLVGENEDGRRNGEGTPAARGSVVTVWGTGVSGDTGLEVRMEGRAVPLVRAAAGVEGLVRLEVRIPQDAGVGRVFVRLREGDPMSRDGVWLWVR
ncbi:MAG: serine hydrolase [Bryobacterales bacterium]|nr:serine hydrolase [Bryobacterales bacterium]